MLTIPLANQVQKPDRAMAKPTISILSSSIRPERKSHRVARYFEFYINGNKLANTEMLDLRAYEFPLFTNRLNIQKTPAANLVEFSEYSGGW